MHLRSSSNKFVENHHFDVTSSSFKQKSDSYLFNANTCTPLAPSYKICRFF